MDKTERQNRYKQLGRRLDERQPEQEDSQWQSGGFFGDTAVGLAAGVSQLPSVATGLADTVTALSPPALAARHFGDDEGFSGMVRRATDRPFSRMAEAAGEATGFQPGEWGERLQEERYSPQMQAAADTVDEAWAPVGEAFEEGEWGQVARGTGRATLEMLRNPRTIQALVTESLPATIAGGLAGRGLSAASGVTTAAPRISSLAPAAGAASGQAGREVATRGAQRTAESLANIGGTRARLSPVAGAAIGQGGVMAGYAMSEIDDEVDPQRAALAALGIGAGGSLIGYGGARLAHRVGLVDIDSAIAGQGLRVADGAPQRGLASRVSGGAVAEGVLQEMPQEALETIGVNWAEGEPLLKDVPRAAVSGMLAGNVMGGAINIPAPRTADAPTDIIHTITQREVGGQEEGRAPGEPLDASSQDTRTLMRYYLRLRRVADESSYPDLQEQALERMTGVAEALDTMGVPRSVLDLEMARTDYTDMRLQRDQMARTYQQKMRTDPAAAQRVLANIQARDQQIAALEQAYGREELEGPDISLLRDLQEQDGTEGYFRSRQGEPTNRLKRSAERRLRDLRDTPDEQLAYELARDDFNRQTNPESPELRWQPMRLAVARERGLDDSLVRDAYNREFTPEGQQAEREARRQELEQDTTDQAAPAAEQTTAPDQAPVRETIEPPTVLTGQQAPAPAADSVTQQIADQDSPGEVEAVADAAPITARQMQAVQTAVQESTASQDAFSALLEALGEQEAGITQETVSQRAAAMYAQMRQERTGREVKNPKQSLEDAVKRLNKRLRERYGDDMPTFTAASLANALAAQGEAGPAQDRSLIAEETNADTGAVSTDDVYASGYQEAPASGPAAIFPGGGYGTLSSAGGAQVSRQELAETRRGIKQDINQALDRAVGRGVALEDARANAQAWLDTHASGEGISQTLIDAAIDQIATASNKLDIRRALLPVRDQAVESLTSEAVGVMPARPTQDQMTDERQAERQRQLEDIQQTSQTHNQQVLRDAEVILQSEIATHAGRYWDKLLHRVPAENRVSWSELTETQPITAANWANAIYEIQLEGNANPREIVIETFVRDFAPYMQETTDAVSQLPSASVPAVGRDAAPATSGRSAAPTQDSARTEPDAESPAAPDDAPAGQSDGGVGQAVDAEYLERYTQAMSDLAEIGETTDSPAGADILDALMAEAPQRPNQPRTPNMERALAMAEAFVAQERGEAAPVDTADTTPQRVEETPSDRQVEAPPTTPDGLLADESGQPLELYHGTGGARGGAGQFMPVSQLDPDLLGSSTGAASAQEGFFFSSSAENAGVYASKGAARDLVDAFRLVRNIDREEARRAQAGAPLTPAMQSRRSQAQQMIDQAMQEGRIMRVALRMQNPLVHDYAGAAWTAISDAQNTEHPGLAQLIQRAKAEGRDGVIMRNISDPLPGDNYVVFDADQVVTPDAPGDVSEPGNQQGPDPVLEPSDTPSAPSAPVDAGAVEQADASRQADELAEWMLNTAADFDYDYQGSSLAPLAVDVTEHALRTGRRLTDQEAAEFADQFGVPAEIVQSIASQPFGIEGLLDRRDPGARELRRRAREAETRAPRSDAPAADGPVTPSTRATSGTGPTVTVRGRRGRRQQAQQLQQSQAATSEAIDQAVQASQENPGPEANSRLAELQRRDTAADLERQGVPSLDTRVDRVGRILDMQDSGQATAAEMLAVVREILGPDHPLMPLVERLEAHPSLQNVRFLPESANDDTTSLGLYFRALHAIHINADHYGEALMDMETLDPSARVDSDIAETVVHELVHAATARAIDQGAIQQMDAEVRAAVMNVRDYVNNNRDAFTDAERAAIAYMLQDQYELMTMPMTSPDAISALRRIPASDSYNRNMLGRVVEMILDLLGLGREQATALEEMMGIVERVSDIDARTTENAMRQVRQAGDVTLADLGAVQTNLELLGDSPLAEAFQDQLADRLEAVDDARMNGDADALVAANEGLTRLMAEIRQAATPARETSARRPDAHAQPRTMPMADRIYDRALAKAPRPMQNWLGDLKNRIKRLTHLSSFSHDFVDMVRPYLPQAGAYFETIFNRLSERNQQHVAIQKIVDPVANFTAQQRDAMNNVLREMTYQEAWGFQPDWVSAPVQVDPAMARKFEALPATAQNVVRDMFRYAYESNQAVQRQLRADIVATYERYISAARSDRQREQRVEEQQQALREHDQRQLDPTRPYLPLKRWGEWAVVHKSDRFRQAERSKNRRLINELKQDPDHYQVVFAETEFAARQERDRMSQELGVEVEMPFQRMRYEQSNEAIPFDLMTRLREEAIGRQSGQQLSAVEQRIAGAIDKLYISALEESSVRKSELRRLKVEGAGRDMVRAFVEHGQGLAALSSAMKINRETRRVIANMKTHAMDPKAGRQRNDRMMALNEVLARHALNLETDGRDNWQQKVMGYTSIWMLLTSPAYYIQNSTQPFMLTYPVLAARFGSSKSMGAMTRAYKSVIDARRDTKRDGSEGLLDPAKLTDPREQMLFTRLQRLGLLDVGIAADLGSLRDARGTIGRGFMKAHGKMLHAVRWVEVYNRGVTALSSFRLQREKLLADREAGRNQLSDSAIDEQAMRYATKAVQTTQGDYSGPNAPRLIDKLPAGRLLTQFRKFQLIQIGLLTRTVHQAFKGADAGERAIGRRQMAYILAMHGMVGGAMGLPAANIIGYALAKAFGDEDEPANAELLARRHIGNKDVADLVLRGLPASLGVDASTRLGMGLTFSIMPFADLSASRDGYYAMLGNLLGPTVGLGSMFADGAGQIAQGNVAMGMTQFMPAALKNATRAYLYKTDGIRLRNGDLAMSPDELTWFSAMTQGIGWPGKQITDRYFSTSALREVDQHFRRRTTQMKRAYTEAFNAGDREAMAEVRDEWRRLQDMRREYGVGLPQSVSVLARAPREQRERERLMVEGVAARRTQQRFVEMLYE